MNAHTEDRYNHQRSCHDLALRMIRHEARTCTIRECTGLSEDRIRRLYRTYAVSENKTPPKRRRGKSPTQTAFFTRTTRAHFESSLLASAFTAFGLIQASRAAEAYKADSISPQFGLLFCDAYETHQQLLDDAMSFEHAWLLLQLLNHNTGDLQAVRCRHCDSHYLRERFNVCLQTCPACRLKRQARLNESDTKM